MSHACRALVLHCIDFRFGRALKDHLESQGLLGDADIAALVGAAKNFADPASREFVMRQVDISKKLHGIREVHLINHLDCGAYGGRAAFPDRDAERAAHVHDLDAAAALIGERHPDVKVIRWIASIEGEEGEARSFAFERIRNRE